MRQERQRSAWRALLTGEAAGGIVLIAAAALALLLANLPATAAVYAAVVSAPAGRIAGHAMSVRGWIDDGLMALFFLLVGLEIKREVVDGRLASPARRRLPIVAAAAGMVVPALVYLAVTARAPALARGWAIPAATDIAFAVGVLALLGRRVPSSLALFLTSVAIVDDMGAVAIIAVAYTAHIDVAALLGAAGVAALLWAMNRRQQRRLAPYLAGTALLWLLTLLSGIHATIAGVVAALMIPARPAPGAACATGSPLDRLEHALQPWVAFAIVPLFGFANAGVDLRGADATTLVDPLVVAVAAGLFLGKQAGVFGGVWIAERLGIAERPAGTSWMQLWGVALVAGIGFTMSLFIGGLAFPGDAALVDRVRIGVLAGSFGSALAGYAVLRYAARR